MDLIDEFLIACGRRDLRPSYIHELRLTLRRLERSWGSLEHATEEQVAEWWATVDVSAGGRLAYVHHLRSFYKWLIRSRRRDDDPTARLELPRQRRGLPRPIDNTDLKRAFELAEAPLDAWLALAAYAGLRSCEIATLHAEDVDSGRNLLFVRDGKGGKQRIVPLHPELGRILAGLPTRPGPLFLLQDGTPFTPNALCQRANRYLHQVAGTSATLHQLRHWFATGLYRQTRDLRLCQEILGHSSPTTTARYCAWDNTHAAAAIGALAPS